MLAAPVLPGNNTSVASTSAVSTGATISGASSTLVLVQRCESTSNATSNVLQAVELRLPRVQHVAFHKVSTEARLTNKRQCYIQMLVSYTSLFPPSTGSGEQAELPASPSKLWMAR